MLPGLSGGDSHDRLIEGRSRHRAAVAGIPEGEDPTVGHHQLVAAAIRRGIHAPTSSSTEAAGRSQVEGRAGSGLTLLPDGDADIVPRVDGRVGRCHPTESAAEGATGALSPTGGDGADTRSPA